MERFLMKKHIENQYENEEYQDVIWNNKQPPIQY
jgi:hypothetical protein